MTGPLTIPVPAPLPALLRQLLAARRDHALVFLSSRDEDCVQLPRAHDRWGYPRPGLGQVRRGEFSVAAWISLVRRDLMLDIRLPEAAHPARYQLAWAVSDPVLAVRAEVTEDQVGQLIRDDLGQGAALPGPPDPLRAPPGHRGTVPIGRPGSPRELQGRGLTYWFMDPPEAFHPLTGPDTAPSPPPGYGEANRETYRFYREVVAGGPVGLAALWLLQKPAEAREVLDWTVAHADLLTDRDGWERTLAATLKGLNRDDRAYVGVNAARLLADVRVPQGEEVLTRITGEPGRGAGDTGGPMGGPTHPGGPYGGTR
ncbi:hypothetical protein [Streptomyces uncialis]|uniref:hypothetical protein n=1 Tax=Streptomyces uncialis TaxID=1048205 RepID=UPI00093E5684|nr:hypothetical protein [Streptomyces uncialis]